MSSKCLRVCSLKSLWFVPCTSNVIFVDWVYGKPECTNSGNTTFFAEATAGRMKPVALRTILLRCVRSGQSTNLWSDANHPATVLVTKKSTRSSMIFCNQVSCGREQSDIVGCAAVRSTVRSWIAGR